MILGHPTDPLGWAIWGMQDDFDNPDILALANDEGDDPLSIQAEWYVLSDHHDWEVDGEACIWGLDESRDPKYIRLRQEPQSSIDGTYQLTSTRVNGHSVYCKDADAHGGPFYFV